MRAGHVGCQRGRTGPPASLSSVVGLGGAAAKAHQPQRGDMFIARPDRNLRKPRRGGMVPSRTGHAAPTGEWHLLKLILPYKTPQKPNDSRTRWPYVSAIPPTGLAEKIGDVVVAINMSLLRSWPNPAHALDGWIPSLLIAGHHCPGLPEPARSP